MFGVDDGPESENARQASARGQHPPAQAPGSEPSRQGRESIPADSAARGPCPALGGRPRQFVLAAQEGGPIRAHRESSAAGRGAEKGTCDPSGCSRKRSRASRWSGRTTLTGSGDRSTGKAANADGSACRCIARPRTGAGPALYLPPRPTGRWSAAGHASASKPCQQAGAAASALRPFRTASAVSAARLGSARRRPRTWPVAASIGPRRRIKRGRGRR
jgi:hypothetical protein